MPCPDVQYSINGKKDIKISGKLRETAFEVMFPEDNDHLGLPYIILDTILQCPLDIRRELADNLFLIGGSTMVMGLMARLKVELLELLKSNMYKDKLFFDSVKFHTAPAKANFTAWLGGECSFPLLLLIYEQLSNGIGFQVQFTVERIWCKHDHSLAKRTRKLVEFQIGRRWKKIDSSVNE